MEAAKQAALRRAHASYGGWACDLIPELCRGPAVPEPPTGFELRSGQTSGQSSVLGPLGDAKLSKQGGKEAPCNPSVGLSGRAPNKVSSSAGLLGPTPNQLSSSATREPLGAKQDPPAPAQEVERNRLFSDATLDARFCTLDEPKPAPAQHRQGERILSDAEFEALCEMLGLPAVAPNQHRREQQGHIVRNWA